MKNQTRRDRKRDRSIQNEALDHAICGLLILLCALLFVYQWVEREKAIYAQMDRDMAKHIAIQEQIEKDKQFDRMIQEGRDTYNDRN